MFKTFMNPSDNTYSFLLATFNNSKKLIKVNALNLKLAIKKACFRYPGKFVNYSNALKIERYELAKSFQNKVKTVYKSMKMFSSIPENNLLIESINDLIDDYKYILILVIDGRAYWLKEHHKFLNPTDEAKRINLGLVQRTENGTYYFYERMTIIPVEREPTIVIKKKLKKKPIKRK